MVLNIKVIVFSPGMVEDDHFREVTRKVTDSLIKKDWRESFVKGTPLTFSCATPPGLKQPLKPNEVFLGHEVDKVSSPAAILFVEDIQRAVEEMGRTVVNPISFA